MLDFIDAVLHDLLSSAWFSQKQTTAPEEHIQKDLIRGPHFTSVAIAPLLDEIARASSQRK
jgi:hypothetical protein